MHHLISSQQQSQEGGRSQAQGKGKLWNDIADSEIMLTAHMSELHMETLQLFYR